MLVDRLERGGWVRRGPHPTDRRHILVELSSRLLESLPSGLIDYHARITTIAKEVPAEHRDAIRSFLKASGDAASLAAIDLRNTDPTE